jgi:hypothetical protein
VGQRLPRRRQARALTLWRIIDGFECGTMCVEDLLERPRDSAQVKPIGDLGGLWRPMAAPSHRL